MGYIFQEINAKLEGYLEVEWDISSEPSSNHQKTTAKTQSPRENTCSQTNISILVLRWPQKMKTMKLWSLIGLTCLLVHIIRAEDQVNKSIPRYVQ